MKKQINIDPKLPKSFETRDVLAGLRRYTFRTYELLQLINTARLDRLIDENLAGQKEEAGKGQHLSGASYREHVKRSDKLSAQYDKLMAERFGPDEK